LVECWLPYGNTEVYVTVNVRDLLSVAEPARQEPTAPAREVANVAFSEEKATKLLEGLASPDCTVSIALGGTTSPASAVAVLLPIVEKFVSLIVPRERITVVIANGVRDRSDPRLLEALRGADGLKGVNLVEHTERSSTVLLGETRQHTPVEVNKAYADAKVKIAIGEVFADHYTGFSGAHTSIIPGISSTQSVEANRKLVLRGSVKPGYVEANQVKEDALEAAKIAGCDLAVQLVDNPQGKLLTVHIGVLEETWGQAIYSLGSGYQINAEVGADIVVVSAGGSKFDYSLYPAAWALQVASRLVRKGGAIILLSECADGLGPDSFTSLAHIEQQAELERRYSLGAEALQVIRAATSKCQVFLVSSLPRYQVEPLGLKVARTANEAYESALDVRRRRTLVVPYGCSTVPAGIP